ncbi:hypothetical protein BGZ97_011463 [Linnemannia gamsii]|uniref:F-box domain-containing protein n=1 Tax=Linnemannia gamsii TaxID=64522 RepID=A0A9P6R8J7_9FUNG|nr:hypothetical protein BGZ97_011463 [Linnemannia gamsii]
MRRIITDLPIEILTVIGDFLSTRASIHASVLTCKLFHEHFSPLLWKALAVSSSVSTSGPDPNNLRNHAHLVQAFSYEGHLLAEYYQISFPRLSSIHLWINGLESTSKELEADWSRLIMLNPTVRNVEILAYTPIYFTSFWDAVFTSLRSPGRLTIGGARMLTGEDTKAFWRACSRFQEIDYKGSDQAVAPHGFVDYDYSRLKRLRYKSMDFAFPAPGLLQWLGKCCNLTKFRWQCHSRLIPLQQFADMAQMSLWPLLDDLHIGKTSGTDGQLGVIIQHLPPLKHWTLKSGNFGPASFAQLQDRHFGSLTTLSMPKVDTFTSHMALKALSNCSQLEVFEARRISLQDLRLSPQFWTCRRLRRLRVFFTMDSSKDIGAETLLLEQLSKLEQLEEIDVSQMPRLGPDYKAIYEPAPQWRLDHGLAQLATLSRLWSFKCERTMQDMRVEDVKWMLAQWPVTIKHLRPHVTQWPHPPSSLLSPHMARITDLPIEILAIIVPVYIRKRAHIRAVILTCRLFHHQFHHLLWNDISLYARSKSPSADALKSNAHLVRRLYHGEVLPQEYYNIIFPHLDRIKLWISTEDPLKEEVGTRWSCFLALNPSVCAIEIFTGASFCLKDFWEALFVSPHSHKRLMVNGRELAPILQQSSVSAFWRACTRFEEIEYHGREPMPQEGFQDMDFSRIRRFHYSPVDNNTEPPRLDWIGKFYNLRDLQYSPEYKHPIPIHNFAVLASIPAWPLLESLELGFTSGSDGSNDPMHVKRRYIYEPDGIGSSIRVSKPGGV